MSNLMNDPWLVFGSSAKDWREAFYIASFNIEDVARVVAFSNGENDGQDWVGVFELKDGRFGYLHAGCDNTGWDCESHGDSHVCDKLDDLLLGFVGEESCKRLGIAMPGSAGK